MKIRGTFKGKNPTNIKVHLKSAHRNANQPYFEKVNKKTESLHPETAQSGDTKENQRRAANPSAVIQPA